MTLPDGVLETSYDVSQPWQCVDRTGSRDCLLEVRALAPGTWALRQSSRVSWEAPVMYLFAGATRALLLDTGATSDPARSPVRSTVDALLQQWEHESGTTGLSLTVAHTHGHNDHTAGDSQFEGRPSTTVVEKSLDSVRRHFGTTASGEPVSYDLGDRHVLVVETPGHDARSICVIDPRHGLMVTGDLAYPGRLYVDDLVAARASVDHVLRFADEYGLTSFLGCHVEVDRHGHDYTAGARFHVAEAALPLNCADVESLAATLAGARPKGLTPGRPMSVYAGACVGPLLRLAARGVVLRLRGRA